VGRGVHRNRSARGARHADKPRTCAHGTAAPVASARAGNRNQVVLYLDGAERQAETDEQRREILRALEDLRDLGSGGAQATTLRRLPRQTRTMDSSPIVGEVFRAAVDACSIDEETLYRDAQSPRARGVVEQHTCSSRGAPSFPHALGRPMARVADHLDRARIERTASAGHQSLRHLLSQLGRFLRLILPPRQE
jgi:hypothetical protein